MSSRNNIDRTALSFWFPQLAAAGLPVPRTKIVPMPLPAQEDMWAAFDGADGKNGALPAFFAEIDRTALEFGYPVFLRTDHTSNKHFWKDTCFLTSAAAIPQHVFNLAEFSEIADMLGMPWTNWVVREMLPTIPVSVCPDYGDMPVCREFRFFVDDGVIRCRHPYWPREALEQGGAQVADYDAFCELPDGLDALAVAAGRAVPGSWSIDLLETERGWFVTDMAEADRSYHWPSCPNSIRHPETEKGNASG